MPPVKKEKAASQANGGLGGGRPKKVSTDSAVLAIMQAEDEDSLDSQAIEQLEQQMEVVSCMFSIV